MSKENSKRVKETSKSINASVNKKTKKIATEATKEIAAGKKPPKRRTYE